MRVTQSSEVAIHAVWYLATFCAGRQAQAAEVASQLQASPSYTVKILKGLAKGGVLKSKRGKLGGFSLARAPAEISLADIVVAVEKETIKFICDHDCRDCPVEIDQCPVNEIMQEASDAAHAVLSKMSIQDLLDYQWRAPIAGNMTEKNNDT